MGLGLRVSEHSVTKQPRTALVYFQVVIAVKGATGTYSIRQARPSFWINRSASTGPHVPA